MAKFHINSKGEPGKCSASTGRCPFGDDGKHFDSQRAAMDALNEQTYFLHGDEHTDTKAEDAGGDSYSEAEIYELAVDELRMAGLLTEGWTVSFGQRTRALGTCYYDKKQIEFSRIWFPIMSKDEARDVVTHEVAHAMVGHGVGHGEKWQAQHTALGGNARATYDSDDDQIREAYKERLKQFYPDGMEFGTSGGVAKRELDPQMIEALKMKYLKKFKQPFDESGLSVPELLQMAQKGELD